MTQPLPKSEDDYIAGLREQLINETAQAAKKVNQSAFQYMSKKNAWISPEHQAEAEAFFLGKIPKVLTKEITTVIEGVLGIQRPSD